VLWIGPLLSELSIKRHPNTPHDTPRPLLLLTCRARSTRPIICATTAKGTDTSCEAPRPHAGTHTWHMGARGTWAGRWWHCEVAINVRWMAHHHQVKVKTCRVKTAKSSQVKSGQVRSSQVRSSQVRSSQVRSSLHAPCELPRTSPAHDSMPAACMMHACTHAGASALPQHACPWE